MNGHATNEKWNAIHEEKMQERIRETIRELIHKKVGITLFYEAVEDMWNEEVERMKPKPTPITVITTVIAANVGKMYL